VGELSGSLPLSPERAYASMRKFARSGCVSDASIGMPQWGLTRFGVGNSSGKGSRGSSKRKGQQPHMSKLHQHHLYYSDC